MKNHLQNAGSFIWFFQNRKHRFLNHLNKLINNSRGTHKGNNHRRVISTEGTFLGHYVLVEFNQIPRDVITRV